MTIQEQINKKIESISTTVKKVKGKTQEETTILYEILEALTDLEEELVESIKELNVDTLKDTED